MNELNRPENSLKYLLSAAQKVCCSRSVDCWLPLVCFRWRPYLKVSWSVIHFPVNSVAKKCVLRKHFTSLYLDFVSKKKRKKVPTFQPGLCVSPLLRLSLRFEKHRLWRWSYRRVFNIVTQYDRVLSRCLLVSQIWQLMSFHCFCGVTLSS